MSCPAKTVARILGATGLLRDWATPGRATPAAHPQTELTNKSIGSEASATARSTSSGVVSSRNPRRVSSSRIGWTIIGGYGMRPSSVREPISYRRSTTEEKDVARLTRRNLLTAAGAAAAASLAPAPAPAAPEALPLPPPLKPDAYRERQAKLRAEAKAR